MDTFKIKVSLNLFIFYRKFVNSLNKRIKGYENSVLILEIYNKLIKFEAVSFLKPALIKLTMQNTEEIHSYDKEKQERF